VCRLAEFEQLCVNNLSTQNSVRAQAEQTLVGLRASAPGQFMQALLAVLAAGAHANSMAREFCAVILRQNLLVNSQSPVWAQCGPEVQKQIQAGLLHLFTTERQPSMRAKITDAVAATATRIAGISVQHYGLLARGLADKQGAAKAPEPVPEEQQAKWDELMPTVMRLAQADAPEMRGSLLDLIDKVSDHSSRSDNCGNSRPHFNQQIARSCIVDTHLICLLVSGAYVCSSMQLAEFNPAILKPHYADCKGLIQRGLKDASMPIRMSALRACISLLLSLEESQRAAMQDCVPMLFDVLGSAFAQTDDETMVAYVSQRNCRDSRMH